MMLYERNSTIATNQCHTFDTGKTLLNFDCHSLALNDQETRLLLVSSHSLAFINLETISLPYDHSAHNDTNVFTTSLSDITFSSLFDECNINRPIVEWNHSEPNQYAVAIDRLVRIYAVDHARIDETNTFIDSHHQRPISTICYSPCDPSWLLTGSLDGQIQVWDTRFYSSKNPASLKFSVSTPFSIRHIRWSSNVAENCNHLAVQCDRCIRVYDIRKPDSYLFSSTDLEHAQRVTCMDWTKQRPSIVTLSLDQSIRMFSANGQLMSESLTSEHSSYAFSKLRTTDCDNLFVCAARDTSSSTHGFVGWRCDEDQYLRPLTDHILTATSSAIVDFCPVSNPRFLNLFTNSPTSRMNDESANRFVLLTWCRDGHLSVIDMDSTFRQAWLGQQVRTKPTSLSDSSSSVGMPRTPSNSSRQPAMSRHSSTLMPMDSIKDEVTDNGEMDEEDDDNAFQGTSISPPNTMESSNASDDNDYQISPDVTNDTITEVTVANELNSLHEVYKPYIFVEGKDEQRRMCVLRCKYPLDNNFTFRIYLSLSRHYPIISQLSVRFKTPTTHNNERFKSFQSRIQTMFEETSYARFYNGQLCLHRCLAKLQNLFDMHYKQEEFFATIATTANASNKKRDSSLANSEIESVNGLFQGNASNAGTNNAASHSSNRLCGVSSSSTRTSDSQISSASVVQCIGRTCGARFSGATHLICFGRALNSQQTNTGTILNTLSDSTLNRSQPLPMRSTSLTVAKSRENSTSVDQSNYRPPTTGTMQIQQVPSNHRPPMFSAPVRSTIGAASFHDHQRSLSYRRSIGHLIHRPSKVAVYDVSILLPVSRKLADDYKIDLANPLDMSETNEQITQEMGKEDLAHCWRLLSGLLSIQPNLDSNDSWFQTPIAQGLIKHLVSNYVINGDIQSASMFLLAMSPTPFSKIKVNSQLVNEHNYDPILYAYAKHNCQSPAPFNQPTPNPTVTLANIICSICLQPVLGQHFLCAVCGHGGHLTHMHDWFSSDELKHRFCPEKDCTCRCITKQQELLTMAPTQAQQQQQQQQTPIMASRSYFARQPSGGIRPL
ncbi:unnamed protein product [Adineta ricciae]|uniref:Uncharacterized protein n=1 Tax=Adineta ricciae TaxID=249248 RepID=A0A813V7E5_ADIRI|nr:unnamed protein product [Adineta ricciae]